MIEFCVQVEHFYSWCVCCPLVAEVIFIITASIRDVCQKPPSERLFPDKYGGFVCLEEIVWKVWFVLGHFKDGLHDCNTSCSLSLFCCSVFLDFALKCFFFFFNVKGVLENTEKERTNRLIRLKPPTNIWSETWLKCLLQSQLCSSPGVWASCGFYSSLKLETKKLSWEII